MPVLKMSQLTQAFGAFTVFSNLTASIEPGERVGLVGPNGIGKTTLLLLLSGITEPYEGSVTLTPGLRIGYLRQEAVDAFAQRENTVYGEMLTVFAGLHTLEARLRELEAQMSDDYSDAILTEYGDVQEKFDALGGYDYDQQIKQVLSGLGFDETHYQTPLTHLSGGQKTRALLARLLLEHPDLLILDEPTNHLDVNALEWLETMLKAWTGALLIASHDRFFLDNVVGTIWEMSRTGMETYKGNYTAYVNQREARWDYQEKLYQTEKERMHTELDYIKANIARASTNPGAVGKLRLLSRDLVGIEKLGLVGYKASRSWSETGIASIRPLTVAEAEFAIKGFQSPNIRPPKLKMRLKSTLRSGESVMRANRLQIGYPGRTLFEVEKLALIRGECAALIGGNGAGKTTLLKTLLNEMQPLRGTITLGMGVKIGYFAQAHNDLDPTQTVVDELIRHKHMLISEARTHLGAYLFRGEDVYKQVGKLSGGERGRLALAILATHGANFMLLDEPTNHLDIPSQEAMQEVFELFEGTILLVSHDRYLINRLATQIWNVEDGKLRVFEGNYAEYLVSREAERIASKTARGDLKAAMRAAVQDMPASATVQPVQLVQDDKRLKALEKEINQREKALAKLGETLNRPQSPDEVLRLSGEYAAEQARLEALMAEWEGLAVVS